MDSYIRKTTLLLVIFFLHILCHPALANDEQSRAGKLNSYITRPDLQAPKWNVSILNREQLSPGYWFVSPYEHIGQKDPGKSWIGPHIYDNSGELIWSGAELFGHMSVMDFRLSKFRNQEVLSLIKPKLRHAVLLDTSFQIIEDLPIEGLNMHDLNFVDEGNHALMLTRGVVNASEEISRVTGLEEGQCNANFHGILELDTTTWQPVWNWSSYQHIGLDETTFKYGPATDRCKHEWDFMHANAVDKCPDGDVIMSTRHSDTIYKISKHDGSILWRLGGLKNDFEMLRGTNFSRQHDVRCRAQNDTHTTISLMDNAKGEDPKRPTSAYSRGLEISLNTRDMTAETVAHYDHPDRGYTFRRGSYQVLENEHANRHVFMGWSEQALHSEHSHDGELLMQARLLPEWLGTYRSYKFPFIGKPLDPPVVVSYAFDIPENNNTNSTGTNVHVSWNGATEVASWVLYRTNASGHDQATSLIARKERSGFETSLSYEGFAKYVIVEARDRNGEVLENGRSRVFETSLPRNLFSPGVAAEELWLQKLAEGLVGDQDRTRTRSDATATAYREGVVFLSGFGLCALLACVAWSVWWMVRSGLNTPWRRNAEQRYLPLMEKVDVSDCESA